jgi:hypothetical protein
MVVRAMGISNRGERMAGVKRRWQSVISVALLGLAAAGGCGTAVKKDFSGIPAGQVGFDDMCGVQGYFDAIEVKQGTPPAMVDGADIERISESSTSRGGRARFAFETEFQLTAVRRVLIENWKRLPEGLPTARRIEINVNWSERAGLHRVASNSNPELVVDGVATPLPYHVCLSELLFGEPLYRQRRDLLGLVPQSTAHSLALAPGSDAGAPADAAAPAPVPAPTPAP